MSDEDQPKEWVHTTLLWWSRTWICPGFADFTPNVTAAEDTGFNTNLVCSLLPEHLMLLNLTHWAFTPPDLTHLDSVGG